MKLVHSDFKYQITLPDKKASEWVLESPALFSKYLYELYGETNGAEGKFVLSDETEEIDIAKYVELVMTPFEVDCNDRRILKKLYSDLSTLAYESESFLATQDMLQKLQAYFYDLEQKIGYPLEIDDEIDISAIWKAMNVRVEDYADNVLEKICQYIKIVTEVLHKKVFVFVNFRSYLTDEQLEQLIELAIYNEVKLLFIENCQRDFLEQCTYCVIDKDECQVY